MKWLASWKRSPTYITNFAEIIWERLHTEAHKLQIGRGDIGEKIPLYVKVSTILLLTVSMDMVLNAPIGTFSWVWLRYPRLH